MTDRDSILRNIHYMDPADFERSCAHLLWKLGRRDIHITARLGRLGFDCTSTTPKSFLQFRRYRDEQCIDEFHFRDLLELKDIHNANVELVSTNTFSAAVKSKAFRAGVALTDGNELVELMIRHECANLDQKISELRFFAASTTVFIFGLIALWAGIIPNPYLYPFWSTLALVIFGFSGVAVYSHLALQLFYLAWSVFLICLICAFRVIGNIVAIFNPKRMIEDPISVHPILFTIFDLIDQFIAFFQHSGDRFIQTLIGLLQDNIINHYDERNS